MAKLTNETRDDEEDLESRKRADLAGPGIGSYEDIERVLPADYRPLLGRRETQRPSSRSSVTSRPACAASWAS